MPGGFLLAQGYARIDTIVSDTVQRVYDYYFDVPFGHTFINPNGCHGYSLLRTRSFDPQLFRSLQLRPTGDKRAVYITWGTPTGSSTEGTFVENNAQGRVVQNQVSNMDYNQASIDNNVMEWRPDNNIPINLVMSLGFGNARLNLTNMMLRSADIRTAEADLVITFNQPNITRMGLLKIKAGTSEVLFRNPEHAHADRIVIENGMGNTTLVLGDNPQWPTTLYLEVGGGECTVSLAETTPVRVIVKDNQLAPGDFPPGFVAQGENTFVNARYNQSPSNAVTMTVDLGMGSFKIIPYKP